MENKKLKLIGEIIKNEVDRNLKDFCDKIKEKLKLIEKKIKKRNYPIKKINIQEIINSNVLTLSIKNFFNSNQLCQIAEELNPLSELTHKRKITLITTVKQKSNLQIREINESHYRKICPVETVEGKNAGLIWSLSKEARINENGFIETPFYVRTTVI